VSPVDEHEADTVPIVEAITSVRERLALMAACAGLEPKETDDDVAEH
jgi:hypothetical protein